MSAIKIEQHTLFNIQASLSPSVLLLSSLILSSQSFFNHLLLTHSSLSPLPGIPPIHLTSLQHPTLPSLFSSPSLPFLSYSLFTLLLSSATLPLIFNFHSFFSLFSSDLFPPLPPFFSQVHYSPFSLFLISLSCFRRLLLCLLLSSSFIVSFISLSYFIIFIFLPLILRSLLPSPLSLFPLLPLYAPFSNNYILPPKDCTEKQLQPTTRKDLQTYWPIINNRWPFAHTSTHSRKQRHGWNRAK